jgi:hypothetical protein
MRGMTTGRLSTTAIVPCAGRLQNSFRIPVSKYRVDSTLFHPGWIISLFFYGCP